MHEKKIGRIEILRAATASLAILFFIVAPISGLVYGTTCALTIGGFALISPLELVLLISGARNLLLSWLISGGIVILGIVLLGRLFCGWVCPVGVLLEYSHVLTEKNQRRRVGGRYDNREKYAILLAVLLASLLFNFAAPYLFSPPGSIYRTILQLTLRGVIGIDLAVILLFLIADLLAIRYGRSWCNTLCPLGTVISSLSIVNLVKPKVDQKTCIDFDFNCLNCERICPMRIPITRADRWGMMECNKCLKCWAECPVKAIKMELFG
ncbi:MAG: 4Fe-4S binding protein [Candidatus Bathyarchaeota archaeon]|nr:4Fe-4S binding protein [Candidatus Bathyarchaeota archaeon]